ncbi:MAG: hypothetical protein IJ419_03280 [Agathobacter sp.]|nr:hypothetical protein [Agathobacter sp.]
MSDNELLLAISKIMDQKMKPLNYRFDQLETSLNDNIEHLGHEVHITNIRVENLENKVDSLSVKTENLENKVDSLSVKTENLENKVDSLDYQMKNLENKVDSLDDQMKNLEGQVHVINLKLENIIEPRLQTIEECYLSTFNRYKLGNEKLDKHELDIQIIQSVLKEDGELLHPQIA